MSDPSESAEAPPPDRDYDAHTDEPPDDKIERWHLQDKARREAESRTGPPLRIPPQNLQAEASLLGAMLLSRVAIDVAIGFLTPDDFYKPAHGHVFEAIVGLHARGLPADPTTVADDLTRAQRLDSIGGPATLTSLQAATPATSNAERYARIVADHSALRRLIGVAGEIAELGYQVPDDVAATIDEARNLLDAVADPNPPGAVPLSGTMDDYRVTLEARKANDEPQGVLSGLADLDELVAGFRPGQLVTICGRTSMGKSAVGGQLAINADEGGHATLVASVEMGMEELQDRYLSTVSQVHTTDLRSGRISDRDWDRVETGLARLADSNIYVLDNPSASVPIIRSAARRVTDLGVIIVDYLQLLTPSKRRDNRQVEVSEITAALKRLARDLNVPVIALAQLNRDVEQRRDKRPMLSDLRESGAIEQDSDVVLGLYRDEYYNPESSDRGTLEIIVLKQRSGPVGKARVYYDATTGVIANMARGA